MKNYYWGKELRRLRTLKKLSRKALSEKTNILGYRVSEDFIKQIELGIDLPLLVTKNKYFYFNQVQRIAKALDVPMEALWEKVTNFWQRVRIVIQLRNMSPGDFCLRTRTNYPFVFFWEDYFYFSFIYPDANEFRRFCKVLDVPSQYLVSDQDTGFAESHMRNGRILLGDDPIVRYLRKGRSQ